jgi:hypothetical protein
MVDKTASFKHRWEWFDTDEAKWKVYADEVQSALNDALKNKKTNVFNLFDF